MDPFQVAPIEELMFGKKSVRLVSAACTWRRQGGGFLSLTRNIREKRRAPAGLSSHQLDTEHTSGMLY